MATLLRASVLCGLVAVACGESTAGGEQGVKPDSGLNFGGGIGGGQPGGGEPGGAVPGGSGGAAPGGAAPGGAAPGGQPPPGGGEPIGGATGGAEPGGTPQGGDTPAGGQVGGNGDGGSVGGNGDGGSVGGNGDGGSIGGHGAGGSVGGAPNPGGAVGGQPAPGGDPPAGGAVQPADDAGVEDAAPPESDAGAPVGESPNVLGLFSLREVSEFSRFGFDQAPRADITAYFRDYSSFPMAAAPRDTEGPCALFLIGDSGDPGRSRPVDGGDITITGGVEPIALTVDNRTFDYLSEPPADALSDLWNPGDLLEFRGPGSDRVGAVQRDLAVPDDVVVTAPVAGDFGALELARDAATVTWTPGNGDYVLLTLSNANADQVVECTVPDDGVIDLPPPALAWFDDGVDTISISLARVRERVFDTANPRARATIRAERLRILEQVDLL